MKSIGAGVGRNETIVPPHGGFPALASRKEGSPTPMGLSVAQPHPDGAQDGEFSSHLG